MDSSLFVPDEIAELELLQLAQVGQRKPGRSRDSLKLPLLQMPDISPAAFFSRLLDDPDVYLPASLLALVNPEMEQDVACVAYKELRAAVRRGVPGYEPGK